MSKCKRTPYTRQEQEDIVDYLISKKSYQRTRGNEVWKSIAEDKTVCKGKRSWQSMRTHFLKYIAPQIDSYNNVTEKRARKFKQGFVGLRVEGSSDDSERIIMTLKQIIGKRKNDIMCDYVMETDDASFTSDSETISENPDVIKQKIC